MILRRAFSRSDDERSSLAQDVAGGFPGDVVGSTGWQQGMIWSGSGSSQTVDQAMRLSAVFACLRILSEAIATLPLDTYRWDGPTRVPVEGPRYLQFRAPQISRIEYLSQLILSLLTDGNAYVLVVRDQLGVPLELVPLDPNAVAVERRSGRLIYRVHGRDVPLDAMMHIKGMTLGGSLTGLSPIGYARESIALGLAAQEFGRSSLENGATPPTVIEVPPQGQDAGRGGEPEEAKARRIAATWNDTHAGPSRAGKTGVLIGGAQLKSVSLSHRDAQYLETRQFQVPDVARIFGVPPHLIADASNSTSWGSGLAEQNLAFGQFSLRPWIERIEEAHSRLLASHGEGDTYVKLNMDALLRASLTDRFNAYSVGIESGILLPNEARALEDLPPIPGGSIPRHTPSEPQP